MREHTDEILQLDETIVSTGIGGNQRRCPACDIAVPAELERCPNDGTVLSAPAQSELAVRYEFLEPIGKGGMSVVYKARHRLMGHLVAIKLLQDKLTDNAAHVKRFQLEAQAAGKLDHGSLIKVTDFGVLASGFTYLVMDYLDGHSLAEMVQREGKLTATRALPLFQQICDGLAHAHSKGVLHRDLKPSNIIITAGDGEILERAKVVDFGIAKVTAEEGQDHKLTATGEVFGSPHYMSPEQCSGATVDERSDIYSMGCLMYEVLSGKIPFAGANVFEVIHKQVNEMPEPLGKLVDADPLAENLAIIAGKALQKDPRARYQSFGEMAADLERISEGNNVSEKPRNVLAIALSGLACFIAVAGTITYFTMNSKPLAPPPVAEPVVVQAPVSQPLPSVHELRKLLPTPPVPITAGISPAEEQAYLKTGIIDLPYRDLKRSDMERLAANHAATKVDLPGNWNITTSDVAVFKDHRNLTSLNLNGTAVDDSVIDVCATMPKLQMLALTNTKVTAEGLKKLAKLPSLRRLVLCDLNLTDADLKALPHLPKLNLLRIDDNPKLTNAAIAILRERVPNLSTFTIRRNDGITDGAIAELVKFPDLANLKIPGTRINATEGVRLLHASKRGLKVTHDAQVDRGSREYDRMATLAQIGAHYREAPSKFGLGTVEVDGSFVGQGPELTDLDAVRLATHPRATHIELAKSPNVTMKGLMAFKNSKVVRLHVPGTAADDRIMDVAATMPDLALLDVSNTKVTPAGLQRLAHMHNLVEVWIGSLNLTNKDIASLPKNVKLRRFKVDGNKKLTDACVPAIVERFPNVDYITVRDTGITDGAIPALLKLPLRKIGLVGSKITKTGIERLTEAGVKVVDY